MVIGRIKKGRTETGKRKNRRRETGDRRQKSEVRGQRSGVGGQRSEVRDDCLWQRMIRFANWMNPFGIWDGRMTKSEVGGQRLNDNIKFLGIALLKWLSFETNNSTSCSKPEAIIRLSIVLNFDHSIRLFLPICSKTSVVIS